MAVNRLPNGLRGRPLALALASNGNRALVLVYKLVGEAFGRWSRLRLNVPLGENLGAISGRLRRFDLRSAVPPFPPPSYLLSEEARRDLSDQPRRTREDFEDEGGELSLANMWASALESYIQRGTRQPRAESISRRAVLTTYGFVVVAGRPRLSVIHYLRPFDAFLAPPPGRIRIEGYDFPIVVRPWLAVAHSSSPEPDGNCWVTFPGRNGDRLRGLLTARHAIRGTRPAREKPRMGEEVTATVGRHVPSGRLRRQSEIMDAAVIEVSEEEWGNKEIVAHSRTVGFKRVRLLSNRGAVDADIVEYSGFVGATIFGEAGEEPLTAVVLFLSRGLAFGDSGCLGLDLESGAFGPFPPYLIYLGVTNLTLGGDTGYSLLLEQPYRVWDLEFHDDATDER